MRCKSCPFGVSKMGDIGLSSTMQPLPSGTDQLLEENLRLKAMIVRLEMDPARSSVIHLLERPHKVDKIIEILERKYGSPETLLAFVSSVINNMERLTGPAKGYPNLNLFYRDVMTVQDALESIYEVDRNVHFVDQSIFTV